MAKPKTKKSEKRLPLRVLAERITNHLRRFEADPSINTPITPDQPGLPRFYQAGAWVAGSRLGICYVSYQNGTTLSADDAALYLRWLDLGHTGRHSQLLGIRRRSVRVNSSPTKSVRRSVTKKPSKKSPAHRKPPVSSPIPLFTVSRRVRAIQTFVTAGNEEGARIEERKLYHEFVRWVAAAKPHEHRRLAMIARKILTTESIPFTRNFS